MATTCDSATTLLALYILPAFRTLVFTDYSISRVGSRLLLDYLAILHLAESTQLPNEYAGHREPNPIVRSSYSLNSTAHVASLRCSGGDPDQPRRVPGLVTGPVGENGAKEKNKIRRGPVLAFSVRQLTVIKMGPKMVLDLA